MPIPVAAWSSGQFPTAKYLNLSLTTSDGTADNPTGTVFLAARPILMEAFTRAATFTTSVSGTQSVMSSSGTTTSALMVYDTAGLYGQTCDLPGYGYYQFRAAVEGSAGDGVTPGGWMLLSHLAAIKAGATQTSVGADLQPVSGTVVAGSRQAPSSSNDSAPFFLDLVNTGSFTYQPAVTISDSASASAQAVVNVSDPSGETCRMYAVWAAVSATTSGQAQYTKGGSYSWTAPAGVTSVTVAATGAGGGGGAGNVSPGGVEYGGGGGGGGQYASGSVSVTPGNVYSITAGAAGAAGASPGGTGGAGGLSVFSGDTASVTAAGGSAGGGATTTANGSGGSGGGGTSGGALFATPGTSTWTCPAGVTSVKAECWGAGQGGGNAYAASSGGSGEYAAETTLAVTPGHTYSYTVGAAGTGGAASSTGTPNSGTAGGNTTFAGDSVTVTAHGGGTSGDGAGGTGSTNAVHYSGGSGAGAGGQGGAGGGSSGGVSSAGNTGPNTNQPAGNPGAAAVTGGGPGGAGGNGGVTGYAGSAPASGPGGGGGQGGLGTSQAGAGGNGYAGQIRLTYSTGTVSEPGGGGAAGVTAQYGGGGGSSAAQGAAGITATMAAGAPALSGGGPGGSGGTANVTVMQTATGHNHGSNTLTVPFNAAVQAGNTVIVTALGQSTGAISAMSLNDGTRLQQVASAPFTGNIYPFTTEIWAAYGVSGAQTSVTVTIVSSKSVKVLLAEMMEVSGLGPSPNTDATASTTASSSSYSVSGPTAAAPDLWVGTVGAAWGSNPSISTPSGNWKMFPSVFDVANSSYHMGLRTGYQVVTAPGTMTYAGRFGNTYYHGAAVAAFTATAATAGSAPVITPGGGGGGGLGANAGGAGSDGQVTLTWTGVSGSGYGTPPIPAPYPTWSPGTTLGTGPGVDVNINGPDGIQEVVNFLCNPPVFRISDVSGASIANASVVPVTFSGDTPTVDSYSSWSSGACQVQRAGLYLFHGLACFAANAAGTRQAGVTVNGTTYWGPGYVAAPAGETHATKTIILSLQAGDTVALAARQDSGGPVSLSTANATRMLMVWLCAAGMPQGNWTPPDTTFRWSAGTAGENLGGSLTALWQAHVANDLGFLTNRPYLLARQSVAQSGLAVGSFSTVTLNQASGLVHGDSGDPWSGWTAGTGNLYTAPCNGWYLVCGETFTTAAAATSATVTAGIQPSTSGGHSPAHPVDCHQALTATTASSVGGGATAFGLCYALAGESLAPAVMGSGFSGPYGTLTGTGNGGTYASHLEIVWISK